MQGNKHVRIIPAKILCEETEWMRKAEEFERKLKEQPRKEWKDVTYNDLLDLCVEGYYSNQRIADYYGVTKNQVINKKRKLKIDKHLIARERLFRETNPKASKEFFENLRNLADLTRQE